MSTNIPTQDMINKVSFRVVFDGAALINHEINVKDLAPALIALAELIEEANYLLNNKSAKIDVNLKGFKDGCFGVDISAIQSWGERILDFLGNHRIETLLSLVFGAERLNLLNFLKWRKNRKIDKVEPIPNTSKVSVTIDNDTQQVESILIKFTESPLITKKLEETLKPLLKEGIETFEIGTVKDFELDQTTTVHKEEYKYFNPVYEEENLIEKTEQMALEVIKISFKAGNKSTFSAGVSQFNAVISDNDFLRKLIYDGIRPFDILIANVLVKQWIDKKGNLQISHEIIKVIKHKQVTQQTELPLDNNSK